MPGDRSSALLLDAICCEGQRTGGEPAAITKRSDRQWQAVLRAAEWHRLGAVLYGHLAGHDAVPEWVMGVLEETYLRQMARAALVTRTLTVALGALAEARIPAMLLKGAALVETVYEDPATRDMGDVDVLVPARELTAAAEALAAAGFHPETDDGHRRAALLADGWHQDVPMVHDDNLLPVELHRQIVNHVDRGLNVDAVELFHRARSGSGGHPHLVPAPEDLLLHACLHFMHGRGIRSEGALAEVRDIVTIIGRSDIDWERFTANARRYGADGRVYLAMFTVAELGCIPPQDALHGLRPATFSARAGRRFVVRRVLPDHVRVPVTEWAPSLHGLRTALWWCRRNLASRRGLPPEAQRPLLSRRRALLRLLGQTARRPTAVAEDRRITKWMEKMT